MDIVKWDLSSEQLHGDQDLNPWSSDPVVLRWTKALKMGSSQPPFSSIESKLLKSRDLQDFFVLDLFREAVCFSASERKANYKFWLSSSQKRKRERGIEFVFFGNWLTDNFCLARKANAAENRTQIQLGFLGMTGGPKQSVLLSIFLLRNFEKWGSVCLRCREKRVQSLFLNQACQHLQ